jgi:hypothetical protein
VNLPQEKGAKPVGLYIEHAEGQGTAILLHPGGIAELGPMNADGSAFKPEKRVDREMDFGPTANWRLLVKHSLLEFYLNDILIECYSLPGWATGRLGLIPGGPEPCVRVLRGWQL